jgi:hypothetical protein
LVNARICVAALFWSGLHQAGVIRQIDPQTEGLEAFFRRPLSEANTRDAIAAKVSLRCAAYLHLDTQIPI